MLYIHSMEMMNVGYNTVSHSIPLYPHLKYPPPQVVTQIWSGEKKRSASYSMQMTTQFMQILTHLQHIYRVF
jgi:hypothetical protein